MKSKAKVFKKSIRNVLIIHRTESRPARELAGKIAEWLMNRKIKVYSHPGQKLGDGVEPVKKSEMAKVDLVTVLGGDGTYLEAVRVLKGVSTPILGVNLGSLGFLTVNRAEDAFKALDMTLKGKMQIRSRSLIRVRVKRGKSTRLTQTALNDVVIERGPLSQLINVSMFIHKQLISPIKADGLIVSTPTGSTAYNLAAGGPILHPDVQALVVTPICPHSLTNRPLVCPDSETLKFVLNDRTQRGILTIDGRKATEIHYGDEVLLERADLDHIVLRKPSDDYFDLLREKLKFGERA